MLSCSAARVALPAALAAGFLSCAPLARSRPAPTIAIIEDVDPAPIVPSGPIDLSSGQSARPRTSDLRWETSEREARERARRGRLPLIVYLRADWAVESVRMEREVWTDPRVVRASRGFVPLKIDVTSAEGDADLYADRYGADIVPTTVLFDAHGTRVTALPGALDADALLDAMMQASE